MPPRLTELIEALPEGVQPPAGLDPQQLISGWPDEVSRRAVPTGRLHRLWSLGTLQGKLAAAYAVWWLRSFGGDADQAQARRNEVHLKAALELLGTMGYLRGAIMKAGQVFAAWPEIAPEEMADVLGRLHFEAPPMHFSLLREFVRGELGADPEEIFDDFETVAFAAASLGQVHRARLKGSGRPVAVKVQYPDIARTIVADMRNLKAVSAPMRFAGDFDSLQRGFDDIRRMLELETDYEHEAENMEIARRSFREADEIVVPRSFREHSTRRVLTMDLLEGRHLKAFLATDPDRDLRDRHGHQIARAQFRLSYGSRLLYADLHPGNYLFMPDGRLGLIDFGCCHRYSDEDVDYLTEVERAVHASPEAIRQALYRATDISPHEKRDPDHLRLVEAWSRWVWEPMFFHDGPFDFGDPAYFRRGVELYGEILRRRFIRALPVNTWLGRSFFGMRAILFHLRARVDLAAIVREETIVK